MKLSAPPMRPTVHAGPLTRVPLAALGEESTAVVPEPSSNFHQPTRPVDPEYAWTLNAALCPWMVPLLTTMVSFVVTALMFTVSRVHARDEARAHRGHDGSRAVGDRHGPREARHCRVRHILRRDRDREWNSGRLGRADRGDGKMMQLAGRVEHPVRVVAAPVRAVVRVDQELALLSFTSA